jgi:hypothetical protein
MTILIFDVTIFRAQCPAYANPAEFPDIMLQAFWDAATYYVSDIGNFGSLQGDARRYALNLMTAHLLYISQLTAQGQVPYVLSASTIDKVQVSTVQVPLKNQWGWWMMISPYGQELWALLQVRSVGGFYIGGTPTKSAFRGYGCSGYGISN